jgi:hypothetical protein
MGTPAVIEAEISEQKSWGLDIRTASDSSTGRVY